VAPRLMSAFEWKNFHLIPSAGIRGTYWGSSQPQGVGLVTGRNATRFARDAEVELIFPALAKIMDSPFRWAGRKWKHVIEPRAAYRYVSGVADFNKTIRFDEIELLTNTNEAEVSVANRILTKSRDGRTRELLSWTVAHKRYFDPTFGGAVIEGRRNVIQSQTDLTGFAYFDRARRYSPIVNAFRAQPSESLGIEWRMDYDPLRSGVANSSISINGRVNDVFLSGGHTQVTSASALSPPGNQLQGLVGLGRENRRGWSTGFFAVYDYRVKQLQFAQSQITYNTDCCGLSFQYRRFSFGTRNENNWRVAFSVANIGSFGNLRRQERFF
jgi:LPS-assembly protein